MLRCRPRSQDTLSALMDHEEEFDKTGIKDTPSDVFDLNERYRQQEPHSRSAVSHYRLCAKCVTRGGLVPAAM